MFAGAHEKSRQFADYYARSARWHGLDFFDAGSVIRSSDADGIHFDPDQHEVFGKALARKIRDLIG
jgi:lysophospholipase L1-like esterase